MVVDYIEAWCANLISRPREQIGRPVDVVGTHDFHTGPSWRYGRIRVVAQPAAEFSVHFDLPAEKIAFLQEDGWLDEAVYGMIDILATMASTPVLGMAVRITEVQHHPIDSCRIAFRMAGRDAARRIMDALGTGR